MATLVYKFIHPTAKQDFYVIWNTFYELPDTVPMDLTTFLAYHININRSFEGLISCWKDLQISGVSIQEMSFDLLNAKVKEMLYCLCENSGSLAREEKNRDNSKLLKKFIDGLKINSQSEKLLKEKIKDVNIKLDRDHSYFRSYSHTMDWLNKNRIVFESSFADDKTLLNYAEFFFNLFLNFNMPAYAVPHIIRNGKDFRKELFSRNLHYLISDVSQKELNAKLKFQFIRQYPSFDELRIYVRYLLKSDLILRESIQNYLKQINKTIDSITNTELLEIMAKSFTLNEGVFNFISESGKVLLPPIYFSSFSVFSMQNNMVALARFGLQNFDIYTLNGELILDDAGSEVSFFDKGYFAIHSKYTSETELYRRDGDKTINIISLNQPPSEIRFLSYSEGKSFFISGYVDENLNPLTPFCFDNGKNFNEGLAPVCLNGRWGYINEHSEIKIDFQYGDAEPFENGFAKVFLLQPEYKTVKGVWHTLKTLDSRVSQYTFSENKFGSSLSKYKFSEEGFQNKFPDFPITQRIPFEIFRRVPGMAFNEKLKEAYHYFADGIKNNHDIKQGISEDKAGKWVVIDKSGNIIYDNTESYSIIKIKEEKIHLQKEDDYYVYDLNSKECREIIKNKKLEEKYAKNSYSDFISDYVTVIENPAAYIFCEEYKTFQGKRDELLNNSSEPTEAEKDSEDYMLNLISKSGAWKIEYASKRLMSDFNFILSALNLNGTVLK